MSTPEEKPSLIAEEVARAVEHAIERIDARDKLEQAVEREKTQKKERLTARVSIAAICLTMLMSFLNFARSERDGASSGAKVEATKAKGDAEANWAYYQTRIAERSSFVLADDSLQREVRDLPDTDPRVRMGAAQHAEYVRRIADIDHSNRQIFFLVQDLERKQILAMRRAAVIDRKVARYDMGIRVLTLAVVLLSVTLLANRGYLFWIASAVALSGAFIAVSGYFLLF